MKNNGQPEKLNNHTPRWFVDWYNKDFWRFRHTVDSRLTLHGKLIWIILTAVIIGLFARGFGFGA